MESDVRTDSVMVNDPAKIMRGLTTIFDGLHMMAGGITEQVELACRTMTDLNDATEAEHSPAETVAATRHAHSTADASATMATATKGAAESKATGQRKAAKEQKASPVNEGGDVDQDDVTGPDAGRLKEATNSSPSVITKDMITQVVVSKIKKNRKNSEAIGKLVEAYGVAQLSDLPEEKYEAFLNDLSQL